MTEADQPSLVVFDLDGTLADVRWRRHYVERPEPDWQAFLNAAGDDRVNESIATLYRALWRTREFEMYIVSSRPERSRRLTELWLVFNNLPFDKLYLRQEHDQRADHAVKYDILQKIKNEGKTILLVIDDRQSVVEMWRRNGVSCLQVSDEFD